MTDSATGSIAPDLDRSSSHDRVVAVSHGAVVVVASVIALLDLLASGLLAPVLAGGVALPLVLLAIGFIRQGGGGREGRLLITVADVAILAIVGTALALASDPYFDVVWRIGPLVLGAITVLALATVPLAASRRLSTPVHRLPWHRIGAVILLAASILPAVARVATMTGHYPFEVALSVTVPSIVGATVLAVAWWYGAWWLLGIVAIGELGYAASLAMVAGPMAGIQSAVGGGLGLFFAARGPRVAGAAVPWRASAREGGTPRAAVIWAVVGSILLVPGVLGGLYRRYLGCSDCRPSTPIVPPLVDVALMVVVLLLAVILSLRGRRGRRADKRVAWLGFIGSVFLLGQAVPGTIGLWGLDGMSVAGPAITLAAVGFAATIRAPAWLEGVGRWSALAWALVAVVWMNSAGIALPPYFNLWLGRLSTLVTGALILVALARESTIRLDAVPAAASVPEDEVPEPVDTETLRGTIRRL
jgi:hypothetical protein